MWCVSIRREDINDLRRNPKVFCVVFVSVVIVQLRYVSAFWVWLVMRIAESIGYGVVIKVY